jgi:hypothetical protein
MNFSGEMFFINWYDTFTPKAMFYSPFMFVVVIQKIQRANTRWTNKSQITVMFEEVVPIDMR